MTFKVSGLDKPYSRMISVNHMDPFERFMYWIVERHNIYQTRNAGFLKPWTPDAILQSNFFTNPYRENDKTTVWFRENIRDPLYKDPRVVFATICFRWFNYIPTGELFLKVAPLGDPGCLLTKWRPRYARQLLGQQQEKGKVFTGAFTISPSGSRVPKVERVCQYIDDAWDFCTKELPNWHWRTMQEAQGVLGLILGLGGFMAYEVVCDLRFTKMIKQPPPDVNSWCHMGPGAVRGLSRLLGLEMKSRRGGKSGLRGTLPKDWPVQMKLLLDKVNKELPPDMPQFEMRELEHSLCEMDKFERVRLGQGRSKRRFNGNP